MSLSRKPHMTKSLAVAGAFILLVVAPACTDLTEIPQSAISPENFYRNADEVIGGDHAVRVVRQHPFGGHMARDAAGARVDRAGFAMRGSGRE